MKNMNHFIAKTCLLVSFCFFGNVALGSALLPSNYKKLNACKKQDTLWKLAQNTEYKKLPVLSEFGLVQVLAMGVQALSKKKKHFSDVAPKGWKKYLHRRGALAKVKFIPTKKNRFSGVFKGASCGLMRLSLTYKPQGDRNFAPGMALKILRDKTYSANISTLYSLEGQGKNFNFFKNPLSNIVPMSDELGFKVVHSLFRKITDYPEELLLSDMATIDALGRRVKKVIHPTQIFFVPNKVISKKTSSKEHDFRKDLLEVKKGTTLYEVYAVSGKQDFDYSKYTREMIPDFVSSAVQIGSVVTTSEFIASEFGDTGIFFRHQTRALAKPGI